MTLNEANLEKKLNTLTQSQESIQTLSQFCLHYKNHHKRIAQLWMKSFQRAKPAHRLTLVYLANEIVQNAKRKHSLSFINDFRLVIKETIPLLKDPKIQKSTERVLDIWQDRNVYDARFITELKTLLNAKNEVKVEPLFKIIHEFRQDNLVDRLKLIEKFENNSRLKEKDFNKEFKSILDQSFDNEEKFFDSIRDNPREKLKFEDAVVSLQTLIKAREKELSFRKELFELCLQAKIYHEEKLCDAKASHDAFKRLAYKLNQIQIQSQGSSQISSSSITKQKTTSTPANTAIALPQRDSYNVNNNSDDDLDIPLPNTNKIGTLGRGIHVHSQQQQPEPMDIEEEKPAVSLDTRLTELLRTFPGLNQLKTTNDQQQQQAPQNTLQQQMVSTIPVLGSDVMRKEPPLTWIPGLDMTQKPPHLLPPNLSIPPPPLMPPQLTTTILPFDPSIMQHNHSNRDIMSSFGDARGNLGGGGSGSRSSGGRAYSSDRHSSDRSSSSTSRYKISSSNRNVSGRK